MDPDRIPSLNAAGLTGKRASFSGWLPPMLLLEFTATDGRSIRLCDFASAGAGGSPYRSWLGVADVADTPFTRAHPLRSRRHLPAQP